MATSKSLRKAVQSEVKQAQTEVKTGNEQTIAEGPNTLTKAADKAPADAPTYSRRHTQA